MKAKITMVPACFSNPSSCSSGTQSLITCIYQTHMICDSLTHLTLTWSKYLFSHSLTIHAPDSFSITISLYPSSFSFFRPRPGTKSISLTNQRIKLHWDFTRAVFKPNSAEPHSAFYIAITCNSRIGFFLGDLLDDITRRSGVVSPTSYYDVKPTLVSRREHIFGHKNYITQAQFMGETKHELGIECSGGVLKVKVDGEISLEVKKLAWKFRGNERFMIDGIELDFYWDVFNWVNNSCGTNKCGLFAFQIGDGGMWPEMVGPEKRLMRKSLTSSAGPGSMWLSSPSPSCTSVLQWAEESSDCGRNSSSSSNRSSASGAGFSLLLYAWRKD